MRRFKIPCFILLFIFVFMWGRQGFALDISAESAVLCDLGSGRVLYSKNADQKMLIASTTKIMTALVAIESSDISDIVEIKYESTLAEGSSMYLTAGEKLTLRELLYGLMLSSGNDAALAIADYCGGDGGVPRFIEMMNERANKLGLSDTHFSNPNGLDAKDHYSTASDLAVISKAAMENEVFASIVGTKTISIARRYLRNHNKLLWTYDGAVGIKTGFTKNAGRALVSAAKRDDRTLIAVTLNAPSDWSDHTKLFDYGFLNFPAARLSNTETDCFKLPVISGTTNYVYVRPEFSISLPLSENELENVRRVVYLPRFVYAPLEYGQKEGEMLYYLGDELIAKTALITERAVPEEEAVKKGIIEKIKSLFKR